jgi:phage head maturation protease
MRFYGTFAKVDAEERMVWGYASTEAVDIQGETILKSAIEGALDDYMEYANIREMHQLSAVGTAEEASVDDRGLYIGAKIVDDVAWGKVTSGVYKGYSVGGKVLARDPDNKKIITKILLTEISLVDRPSNPKARFDVWKAAGAEPVVDPLTKATTALDKIDAAVATVAKTGDVAKSIYSVANFAEIMSAIANLARDIEFRDKKSLIAKQLRDWLKTGAAIFRDMGQEDVDAFAAQFEVKKVVPGNAADVITKAIAVRDNQIENLSKRVVELEAEPAPPKTAGTFALISVSKETDAGGAQSLGKTAPSQDEIAKALSEMTEEDRAMLLIKASMQLPRPVTMVQAQ